MTTLISLLIVAFGQPAWMGWLGLVAAACGYAIFWSGMLRIPSRWRRFLLATTWFTTVQLIQLSWMTSDDYQGLYTWFFWAFLSVGMGVQFGLISLLLQKPYTWLRLLAVPAAWTIMEWLRLYFLAGMTWNPVGLALTGWTVPRQMAAFVGIYGLSFWVIFTNVLFLRKRWKVATVALLVPYVLGVVHLGIHTHLMAKEDRRISVLLVQPGICPAERSGVGCGVVGMMHPFEQWRRLLGLVGQHRNEQIDLVVFPEGVAPFDARRPSYEPGYSEKLVAWELGAEPEATSGPVSNAYFCQAIANALDADVIAGLDDRDEAGVYNAALFFQPGRTEVADRYEKRILLPIVENVSSGIVAKVAKRYGISGGFVAGEKAHTFNGNVPMGISICYEETFSQITRENKAAGAELLVNLSNDGWYPHSKLPQQHFYHGRLRAVENGMPLLRSCSVGVTAAVDSFGRTIGQIEVGEVPGALLTTITPYNHKTLYGILGDGLPVGSAFLIVLLFLRRRR